MMMFSLLAASAALIAAGPLSSEVTAGDRGVLEGTLLKPAGKLQAAMIIIPGSGPTDRDGNNPAGIRSAYLRKFAEAMAERGTATVRIDKRGMFGSAGAGNPNDVTFADYDADVRSWVEKARKATGRKCVWVAGHSEGGLLALRAAKAENICGVVLLAAPGQKLGDTIRKQLQANPANAPLLTSAEQALSELEAGRRVSVEGMHPALAQGLFNPAVQGYAIELLRQDPAKLAGEVSRPMLIVQGGRDLQVDVANGEAIRKAAPKASYALLQAMNHVLTDAPEERSANLATYADPSRQLSAGLADRVAAFVTRGK
jgi:alpha-beta hydrolase superfamily lysophospholipase